MMRWLRRRGRETDRLALAQLSGIIRVTPVAVAVDDVTWVRGTRSELAR